MFVTGCHFCGEGLLITVFPLVCECLIWHVAHINRIAQVIGWVNKQMQRVDSMANFSTGIFVRHVGNRIGVESGEVLIRATPEYRIALRDMNDGGIAICRSHKDS